MAVRGRIRDAGGQVHSPAEDVAVAGDERSTRDAGVTGRQAGRRQGVEQVEGGAGGARGILEPDEDAVAKQLDDPPAGAAPRW